MKISVRTDGTSYRLWYEDGKMCPMPAGARLFHPPKIPDIKFEHGTIEAALRDAALLTKYISETHKNAKDSRKHGA